MCTPDTAPSRGTHNSAANENSAAQRSNRALTHVAVSIVTGCRAHASAARNAAPRDASSRASSANASVATPACSRVATTRCAGSEEPTSCVSRSSVVVARGRQ